MRTKVLVTGAGGQLARSIKYYCRNNSHDIDFSFVTKEQLDITKRNQVFSFFEQSNFDYCVNCAAYTNVEQAEEERELANLINVDATKQLAEICKTFNTTLIHISTDYIFDGTNRRPYLESDKPSPINYYGHTKNEGERAIMTTLSNYFILRTSWLYSMYGKNFVTTIVNKIKQNANLTVVDSQIGSPTSCHELAKFIVFLIASDVKDYGVYNFTDKGETNWYNFALTIASHFKDYDKAKLRPVTNYKTRAERPIYSVLSNAKRNNIYPHFPQWQDNVEWVVNQLNQA